MTTKPFGQKGLQNMRVLLDTNVILDVLCARELFLADASKVWKLCEVEKLDGHLSALSIPNIVYILRKELDPVKTKQVIDQLSLLFSIEDLKAEDLKKAAAMQPRDYEDALQMVCASRIKADFIVTRNIKDFLISKVPAVTPSELLARL